MSDPQTVDEALKLVRAQGLRVNNLFQRKDGMWQSNLRRDSTVDGMGDYFSFGYGPDAVTSMIAALDQIKEKPKPGRVSPTITEAELRAEDPASRSVPKNEIAASIPDDINDLL